MVTRSLNILEPKWQRTIDVLVVVVVVVVVVVLVLVLALVLFFVLRLRSVPAPAAHDLLKVLGKTPRTASPP